LPERRFPSAGKPPPPPPLQLKEAKHRFFDSEAVGAIADACRAGDIAGAEKDLRELLAREPKVAADERELDLSGVQVVRAAQIVVDACSQADPERAAAWLDLFLDAGVPVGGRPLHRAIDALVTKLQQQGRRRAEEVFAAMVKKGVEPDEQSFHSLFDRCVPVTSTCVEEWLTWMCSAEGRDAAPMFVGLIRSHLQTPSPCQAEDWVRYAMHAGVTNLAPIVNALLSTCVRSNDLLRAESWLKRMEDWAAGRAPTDGDEVPCAPDLHAYHLLMDAHAARKDDAAMERLFGQMRSGGALGEAACFSAVVMATCRHFEPSAAMKWLRVARETGAQLAMDAYAALIGAWAKSGMPKQTDALLSQALQQGLRPGANIFSAVMVACAKQERMDPHVPERLVQQMIDSDVEPTLTVLGAALQAYSRVGDDKRAQNLFERVMARGHVVPDAICFNGLIGACAKAGDVPAAERWLEAMFAAGVTPNVVTYTAMLHACARNGDIEAAERGFEMMRANHVAPNVVSYCALMQACVKSGDMDRAEKWFNEMRAQGVKPNAVSYSAVLDASAKAGDWRRAERWLAAMDEDGVPPTVVCFNNVINACSRGGQPARAEAWLRKVMREDQNPPLASIPAVRVPAGVVPTRPSFTAAAQAYSAHGSYADVERIFDDMRLLGMDLDEFCFTTLINSYTRARPRVCDRAIAALTEYVSKGHVLGSYPTHALRQCLGPPRLEAVFSQLGLPPAGATQVQAGGGAPWKLRQTAGAAMRHVREAAYQ